MAWSDEHDVVPLLQSVRAARERTGTGSRGGLYRTSARGSSAGQRWNANVVPIPVPPARDVGLALRSEAGPKISTPGADEALPQPGVALTAVACNCPGRRIRLNTGSIGRVDTRSLAYRPAA